MTTLYVRTPVQTLERLFVVGDCESLGTWLPYRALPLHMNTEMDDSQIWSVSLNIPSGTHFRFFLGHQEEELDVANNMIIKSWETNLKPRDLTSVEAMSCSTDSPLQYGRYGGVYSVRNGWLTCQSEIHLRLHSNAVKSSKASAFRIFCSAFRCTEDGKNVPIRDVVVSVLGDEDPSPRCQTEDGALITPDDYVDFSLQTCFSDSVVFCFTVRSDSGDFLGRVHMPSLKDNHGFTHSAIMSNDHQMVGELKVDHLVVHPLPNHTSDMRVSYAQHWKDQGVAFHIGHRGSGNSFSKTPSKICENTLRSLQYAGDHGADFVEFDVHLSHDHVPVVYHDFNVCVAASEAKNSGKGQWVPVPIHSLTLAQMKSLKFGHMSQLSEVPKEQLEELSPDVQPFTKLTDFLCEIDPLTGFDVEVKYCCREKSGLYEEGLQHFEERNSYVDCILKNMLPFAKDRRIIFSCFDPDVCTMLSLKQPLFPVFFLSLGQTSRYDPYLDPRCNDVILSAKFSQSQSLMGIVAHSEDLLRDLSIIEKVKDIGVRVLSWGDDNNSQENLEMQEKGGVDGLVYDRIYEHRDEGNIFKRASKKTENGVS